MLNKCCNSTSTDKLKKNGIGSYLLLLSPVFFFRSHAGMVKHDLQINQSTKRRFPTSTLPDHIVVVIGNDDGDHFDPPQDKNEKRRPEAAQRPSGGGPNGGRAQLFSCMNNSWPVSWHSFLGVLLVCDLAHSIMVWYSRCSVHRVPTYTATDWLDRFSSCEFLPPCRHTTPSLVSFIFFTFEWKLSRRQWCEILRWGSPTKRLNNLFDWNGNGIADNL